MVNVLWIRGVATANVLCFYCKKADCSSDGCIVDRMTSSVYI